MCVSSFYVLEKEEEEEARRVAGNIKDERRRYFCRARFKAASTTLLFGSTLNRRMSHLDSRQLHCIIDTSDGSIVFQREPRSSRAKSRLNRKKITFTRANASRNSRYETFVINFSQSCKARRARTCTRAQHLCGGNLAENSVLGKCASFLQFFYFLSE